MASSLIKTYFWGFLGYLSPIIISFLAIPLGLAAYPASSILWIVGIVCMCGIGLYLLMFFKRKWSLREKTRLLVAQNTIFLGIFLLWVSQLNELRPLAMVCAFIPYTFFHLKLKPVFSSLIYSTIVATVYMMGSIIGWRYLNHSNLLATDFLVSLAFIASCAYLAFLLERVRIKDRAIIESNIKLRQQNYTLFEQVNTDALTGLKSRSAIEKLLEYERDNYLRERAPFSILLLDIDFFKKVNDTYGHSTGDAVLQELASKLSHVVRRHDSVARWGGEEFLVLLPDTKLEGAKILAEKTRRFFSINLLLNGDIGKITLSIGCAQIAKGMSLNELFEAADRQLYAAKRNGRNRVC